MDSRVVIGCPVHVGNANVQCLRSDGSILRKVNVDASITLSVYGTKNDVSP